MARWRRWRWYARPIHCAGSSSEIEELYRRREAYYRQAHVTVDTSGLGPDEVVARVMAALREHDAARV